MVIVSDTVHQKQHTDFLARHISELCQLCSFAGSFGGCSPFILVILKLSVTVVLQFTTLQCAHCPLASFLDVHSRDENS
jgi:hypothetical protein